MKLVSSKPVGQRRVYDIEVADVHNFYANGVNVHNCATDGGVSVIKDDGSVVDSGNTSNSVDLVSLDSDRNLYIRYGNSIGAIIPEGDYLVEGFSYSYLVDNSPYNSTRLPALGSPQSFGANKTLTNGNSGIFNLAVFDPNNYGSSLYNYISSTYNTGWMNGDIKLATLSDTDATNVTGTELVTNGTFDTDVSGWSVSSDTTIAHEPTSPANSIRVNATAVSGTPNAVAYQAFSTEVGKTYTVTATGIQGSGNYGMGVGTAATNISYAWDGYLDVASKVQSYTFVATATTAYVSLLVDSTDGTQYAFFDNISVRLAEEDRSVNNNGLQVFGTVTKTPVATGADLVAYSGFSGSNYLQQPYNSDLDFGTGDFCVMGWFKYNATAAGVIAHRGVGPVNSNEFVAYVNPTGDTVFRIGSSANGLSTANGSVPANTWTHIAHIRSNSIMYTYVNGVLKNSRANTESMTQVGQPTTYGVWPTNLGNYFTANLALWRWSATVPTDAQLKRIYEDEKVLFQEGAQATLYGSSDAVTALAYDDSTDLLHVGTSAGRSVFSGLRRVDNTTDAVGSCISAVNNLVVED